jgi:hypothetical protein
MLFHRMSEHSRNARTALPSLNTQVQAKHQASLQQAHHRQKRKR